MADNTLGKGEGTTNPTPNSKVEVPVEVPVKVMFRFFAANVTAELEGVNPQKARALAGLPFVVGVVEGKTFKPLHENMLRLEEGRTTVGKLQDGIFVVWTADEIAAWHKSLKDAKKPDKAPPAYLHHDTPQYSVKPGVTLGICIAIDAKKKWRRYPLWQVTAQGNDIVVNVFETFGKMGLQETVGKAVTRNEGTEAKPKIVEIYGARLSGDTWMRSTPKYTVEDVDAIAPERATVEMKQALKRIYSAEFDAVGSDFSIVVPRKLDEKDKASVRLLWRANENGNCLENISILNLKQDVPSRIHPEAYAAAAKAAHEAEIDEVQFSSSWRPMLGSMPHRLSLGLDLVYLKSGPDGTRLNRDGLLLNKNGKHVDVRGKDVGYNENLTQDELEAYDEWQAKERELATARSDVNRADKAVKAAADAARQAKNPAADESQKLKAAVDEAKKSKIAADDALKTADEAAELANASWRKKMAEHEPNAVGRYRRYVMGASIVSQVLDPWYLVGLAAHKRGELVPNMQVGEGGLALQHNNHMHLSIRDPELG